MVAAFLVPAHINVALSAKLRNSFLPLSGRQLLAMSGRLQL